MNYLVTILLLLPVATYSQFEALFSNSGSSSNELELLTQNVEEVQLDQLYQEYRAPLIIINGYVYIPGKSCYIPRRSGGALNDRLIAGVAVGRKEGGDTDSRIGGGNTSGRNEGGNGAGRSSGGDDADRKGDGIFATRKGDGADAGRDSGAADSEREDGGMAVLRSDGGTQSNRLDDGDEAKRVGDGNSQSREDTKGADASRAGSGDTANRSGAGSVSNLTCVKTEGDVPGFEIENISPNVVITIYDAFGSRIVKGGKITYW